MKLKPFITHAAIFIVGASVASSYFLLKEMPSTAKYVTADMQQIKLADDATPVSYSSVLQQDYLGVMYLRKPIYFFYRNKGYKLLTDLANKGYSQAAFSLHDYEINQYHKYLESSDLEAANKHYKKAYEWAMLAARQGFYFPLQMMVKIHGLDKTKDITEELEMLKEWARKSSIDATSYALWEYYDAKGEQEKAKYWLDTSKQIASENRPKPSCTVISPWRGY